MTNHPVPVGMFTSLATLEQAGAITKTAIVLPPNVTYEQYEAMFGMLGQHNQSICWWIGDLCNYGEKVYGEKYADAADWTGLHPATLMKYASVCSRIPRSRRLDPSKLSFGHHVLVAYLPPKEQSEWLSRAHREGWTINVMREHMIQSGTIQARKTTPKAIESTIVDSPPAIESDDRFHVETVLPGEELFQNLDTNPDLHICQCPACGRYHRSDHDVMK